MRKSLFAAVMIAALVPTFAAAQSSQCVDREVAIDRLEKKYSETRAAIATTSKGGVMEIFSGPDGTWTLMVTVINPQDKTKKRTCVMEVGENWTLTEQKVPGTDS